MFDHIQKLKDLFKDEKESGFFRNIMKGVVWVLGLCHYDEIEARVIKLFKDLARTQAYDDIKLFAMKFYRETRSRILWASFLPIFFGWAICWGFMLVYYLGGRTNALWLQIGLIVALVFGTFGSLVFAWQSTKAYGIMWLATGLERIADATVEKIASTLPDVFFEKRSLAGAPDTLKKEMQEVGRKIWLPVLVTMFTHLLLVNVVWALDGQTINGLTAMLLVVDAILTLVAGSLAFGRSMEKFDRLSESMPKAMVVSSIIIIALTPVFYFAWTAIKPYKVKWDTEAVLREKAAEIKAKMAAERAEQARKIAFGEGKDDGAQKELWKIEKKVLDGTALTDDERKAYPILRKKIGFAIEAGAKAVELPKEEAKPAAPVAVKSTCSDGSDNNNDGVADDKDFSCFAEKPNCAKAWKLTGKCRNSFPNYNLGKDLKDEDGNDRWFVYDPNRDEKDIPPPEKKPRTASNNGGTNGNGNHNGNTSGTDSRQEQFKKLYALKCRTNPQWCRAGVQ